MTTRSSSAPTHWITTASPTIEAVANPLIAACTTAEYVPDTIRILDNPGVREASRRASELLRAIVTAFRGTEPDIETVTVDSERNFGEIVEYHKQSIVDTPGDGSVAIDVTPGRKFMSAIAFQAGIQFDAEHVFYLYLRSDAYYNRLYPDIPRTGVDLVDFTEVF